ncbi:helix-turn-helix domain-containing protein [Brevundimonas sanguinis]|uniref:helix-turn-helix domain-containing protein n=1 Tax=Brevundimonas sanguinis TaxID=3021811 RepID=UPI0024157343|nr:AraC family transcriptional regulator [Brevundimonas sp. NCCP 15609]
MRFTHYVNDHILPVTQIEIRECANRNAVLALASHAPSCGVNYDPIDDLIVSIVLVSNHSRVVRDIGGGRQNFIEAPGCILVTPPKTPSYWYFESTPLVLHVTVPGDKVKEFTDRGGFGSGQSLRHTADQPFYDPLISHLAYRMWSVLGDPMENAVAFNTHAIAILMSVVYAENVETPTRPKTGDRRNALAPWRLKQVTALMTDRLSQGLTVDEMADSVELSTDHFLRSFATATGRTPHQCLTEMRMEKAKQLLRGTELPAAEIALELGYSSPAHFSSRFRQIVGISPSAWRKAFANDPGNAG